MKTKERIGPELRAQVWAKTAGFCWYCGIKLGYGYEAYVVDHGCPKSRGGETVLNNLFPACLECNHDKSTSNQEQYRDIMKTRLQRSLERITKALRRTKYESRLEGVDFENFRFFGERG